MERVLHRDQKLIFHRPILAGDKLCFDSYLDSVIESHGAVLTEIRGEVTDADGKPVITSIVTVLGEAAPRRGRRGDRTDRRGARCRDRENDCWAKLDEDRARERAQPRNSVPAVGQQLIQRLLDGLADLVGQLERDHRILGGRLVVVGGLDRLAELDVPLRRQRHHPGRPCQREQRGHREVRQPEQPGQQLDVGDHRVDLLGADDRARHDRRLGPQRGRRRTRRGRSAAACSDP